MNFATFTNAEMKAYEAGAGIGPDVNFATFTNAEMKAYEAGVADKEAAERIAERKAAHAAAKITPLRRVISCAPSHAWIATYDQTFTSMRQVIQELHANGYETAADYGTTKHTMVYKNGAIVAEVA